MITIKAEQGKTYAFPVTKAPAKGSKAKGSTLHQRGFKSGVEIDINSIPPRVLEKLLLDAIEAKLQAAVKKLDQDKCTEADAQAAMTTAFEALKSGTAAKRTASFQTQVRAEARRLLKAALKERNDSSDEPEELDAAAYTEKVKEAFKMYDEWQKTKDPDLKEELTPFGEYIQGLLTMAEKRLKDKANIGSALDKMLAGRSSTASDGPAPAKPTPTQAEGARRAKAKGQGPTR